MAFLGSGGARVLVISPDTAPNAAPLLGRLGIDPGGGSASGTATVAQPFDSTDRVGTVPVSGGLTFTATPAVVPLIGAPGRVGANGRVFVLGDAQPLSNDGLRHDDSAFLALSLLQRARGGRIGFDEFHHGESNAVSGAGAIFDGPVGRAALLVALVVLLAIALNGRRLGKPASDTGAYTIPSARAYVTAMGQ